MKKSMLIAAVALVGSSYVSNAQSTNQSDQGNSNNPEFVKPTWLDPLRGDFLWDNPIPTGVNKNTIQPTKGERSTSEIQRRTATKRRWFSIGQ